MSTIYDVAKLAGVSVGTVSRYLNGSGYVSQRARQRIQAAIEQLGFVPSGVARSLSTKKTGLIGFVVSDLANPFTAEVARGLQDHADAYGYNVIICNTDGQDDRTLRMLRALREHEVEGLVITPPETPVIQAELVRMRRSGVPMVLIGMRLPGEPVDRVTTDTYSGAVSAVRFLLDLGHRRIGLIGGSTVLRIALGRRQGYIDALRAAGIDPDPVMMTEVPLDREGGMEAARQLLDLPHPPTAIFSVNDAAALGAIQEAFRRGLSVPEDLSVVGFDDIALAAHSHPPLTTVAQPKQLMGREAIDLLLARIQGTSSLPAVEIRLPCELVVRGTTSQYRGEVVD